ncbi:MAG: ATP-binding cassette domain-containing protein, partial [Pseudarcicella sp.]|nr:ATP-binding cassette domain-containing protein [Pseudarcicella sp.]
MTEKIVMEINVSKLGKKFQNEWIFRDFSCQFSINNTYTFIGANGSGKSTLLKVIAGSIPSTTGEIVYSSNNNIIHPDDFYKHLNIASPYLELIEEFTLSEFIAFHVKFKPLIKGYTCKDFIDFIELSHVKNKELRFFSSGMKQKVKLGLAFMTDSSVVMLDEPTSNF